MLVVLYFPLAVRRAAEREHRRQLRLAPEGLDARSGGTKRSTPKGPGRLSLHSLQTAAWATSVALVLGTLAGFALSRYRFFGRGSVSLAIVLPIALPGIVTGIALLSAFERVGIELSLTTLVIAHATFCVVIVYNNVGARMRRMQGNLEEVSADLGADGMQTFRFVTFPLMGSALLAGGLLAFALSFDEIVVTTFTVGAGYKTLPIWFAENFARPNAIPIVNVVATFVVIVSIIPVYFAQRLINDPHAVSETAA